MKLKIFLLFAFLLLFNIFYSVCVYEKEETYFPEVYDLSCDEKIISKYEHCLTFLEETCIENTSFPEIKFPSQKEGIFSGAINYFSGLRENFEELKEMKKDLIYTLARDINKNCIENEENETLKNLVSTACGGIFFLPSQISFPACFSALAVVGGISLRCSISEAVYVWKAGEIIENQNYILENANKGINEVLKKIYEKRKELYCMGAGYENYSGSAKSYYLRTEDFFSSLPTEMENYSNERRKTVSSLNDAKKIKDGNVSGCKVKKYIENLRDVVSYLVSVYEDLENGINSMKNEYESLRREVNENFNNAKEELGRIKNEKLDTLTVEEVRNAINKTEYLSEDVIFPYLEVPKIYNKIYGIGGMEDRIKEVENIYSVKDVNYAAISIEKLKQINKELKDTIYEEKKILDYADNLIIALDKKAITEKEEAEKVISSYEVSGKIDYLLLNNMKKKKEEVDLSLQLAQTKTKGERIKVYLYSIKTYNEISSSLLNYYSYVTNLKEEATKIIKSVENLILRAKNDGIDTQLEEKILGDYSAIINYSKNDTEIKEVIGKIENIKNSIYSAAEAKYYYLSDFRKNLLSELNAMKEVVDVSNYISRITKFDVYLKDDKFSPEKTIGNYLIIKSELEKIKSETEKFKTLAIQNYLAKKIKVKTIYSKIYTNQPSEILTRIEIYNDLSFGTNETLTLKVPYTLSPNSEIKSSLRYSYDYDKNLLNIYVNGIQPGESNFIEINSKDYIVKAASSKKTIFYENKMEEIFDVILESNYQIEYPIQVVHTESTKGDFCRAISNNLEQTTMLFDDSVTVELQIQKGKSKLTIFCVKYNPFTFYEESHSIVDYDGKSKIEYILNVKSNIGTIYEAEINKRIEGNVIRSTISVLDPNGYPPKGFAWYNYSSNYVLLKWKVDVLDENYQSFKISYEVENKEAYLKKLIEMLQREANESGINVSDTLQSASSHVSSRNYERALKEIEVAKKKIEEGKNIKIQIENINKKIKELEEIGNKIFSFEVFSDSPDIFVEFSKNKKEFFENINKVKTLIQQNKTSEAISVLKEIEKSLSTKSIDNEIYKQQEKLFKNINSLKSFFYEYSKISNLSNELLEIEAAGDKIKNISLLIESKNYSEVENLMKEINSAIKNLENKKKDLENNLKVEILTFANKIKKAKSSFESFKEEIVLASYLSPDSPFQINYSIEVDLKGLEKMLSELDNFRIKVEKIKNVSIDELKYHEEIYDEFIEKLNSSEKIIYKLKMNYEDIFNLVKKQLDEKIKTEGESKETIYLQSILGRASKEASEGKYLNSLSYLLYAKNKLSEKKKEIDLLVFIIPVVTAVVVVIIYLIMKREKKPRIIKKAD